jgi:hypothetical protein
MVYDQKTNHIYESHYPVIAFMYLTNNLFYEKTTIYPMRVNCSTDSRIM